MHSLTANLWNESLKITYKKKTLFFLAFTLLLPLIAGLLLSRFQSGIGIGAIASQDFPIIMLGLLSSIFLPLFIFMGAADVFAGEMGDRTMKNTLTRPITRIKVFASKQLALGIFIALYLAAGLLASVVSALFFQHFGGLSAIAKWFLAYGAAFLPLLVLSMGAVFLAQFFSSSSSALTVSILLYLAFKVAAFFIPQIAMYSPTAYTDWHMLWIGSGLALGKVSSIFMFLIACSILFFTAGYYVFDKKEI
ncbi:ABC transporter permease subunit [Paenibacillus sp. GCM10023248]|uniref:ABC transporter permease subunit n=1 Tax=unclassified Paenibacillus TaxID=185978 RepID=UPI0023788FE2|nr:ABC transporter permease subunit [Paenibacillus sp. MAHUQ-63]MDD9266713.1 ABC transporter permease subunit [Paenibacillus sp. MAHUQ-63]